MEEDGCDNEPDQCTYTLYSIIPDDCNVRTMDFDELGSICAAGSQSPSPLHYSYLSLDSCGQVHEGNTVEHVDNHGIVVQEMVEEEVNVRGDFNDNSQCSAISTEHELVVNDSEGVDAYIEYVQNVVMFSCCQCSRKFTRLQTLKGHMKRQHGISRSESHVAKERLPIATACRHCDYVGTTQEATRVHVVHKHRLPVARSLRQRKTNPQRLLLNRQRMAAQKAAYPPIVCLICNTEIGLLKNYHGHIKRYHHSHSRFAEALSDVRRIQFERTENGDGTSANCETCGESYDENKLIAHIRWKHGNEVNVKELIAAVRQSVRSSKQQHMVSCPHCGRCLRQISLANHIKFYCSASEPAAVAGSAVSIARDNVQCEICCQSMPRPKLFRHRRLVHRIGTYKQIETFMCEFCPREFTEAHQLRTHIRKHTGIVLMSVVC